MWITHQPLVFINLKRVKMAVERERKWQFSEYTLKLLIDTKGKKVLFAEVGKDFIDFLFSILAMPIGTIIRLFSTNDIDMVGTLGKLYQSLENLSQIYIQSNVEKDTLLKPKLSVEGGSATLFSLTNNDTNSTEKKLYYCSYCSTTYGRDDPRGNCHRCNCSMRELTYAPAPKVGSTSSSEAELVGGFVKGVVTYMIMDDLEVKPMSTISCIALLNTFRVTEVGALEEKTVSVGIDEGLSLLKASL
ncbi:uncharacterized protein LOC133825873 [Humulus lupulus]|uniref:uncharacterized protein LOC133825873 n=1 Tax=Humulus lupulus TaxID=3486 RepID=UPI002B414DED|nr:uncharacterized protein LOC133825873 [Humulus lupulus]